LRKTGPIALKVDTAYSRATRNNSNLLVELSSQGVKLEQSNKIFAWPLDEAKDIQHSFKMIIMVGRSYNRRGNVPAIELGTYVEQECG